ncbi:MAG: magnesium transporter [Gammaproteobacteria bacterium]|nr:magnesium transporter [Gammaproteobacteria bacterium]MCY4281444.1 magnesium transporter [Gammaproteobacteria bacterium]
MQEASRQEILFECLEDGDFGRVRSMLESFHPSEIADLLESLPGRHRRALWELVDPDVEGEVLTEVQDAVRAGLLAEMQPQEVAEMTRGLDPDEAADILQDLPEERVDSVLLSMDAQNRERIASLLSYPEDTAGGLMDTDVVWVRADVTLDVVTRYLRQLGELPDHTDSLIVVDRQNRYLGVLSLAEVLVNKSEDSVGEHMSEGVGIPADTPEEDVARLFEQRDLISAAVLDEHRKLLGRITIDDVVDVIQDLAEQSVRNMAGLGEDDLFASVLSSARRRAVWLGISLLSVFLAAWVIGRFEATIEELVALAILMPIVAGLGGSAGSQALTISVRGLALGRISRQNARSLVLKECAVGLLNGVLWAAVVGVVATLWFGNEGLGLIISLAMVINLVCAALAGSMIPLALKKFGVDPAIAGGVILTTVTDVIGFMTFLGLATIFLLP